MKTVIESVATATDLPPLTPAELAELEATKPAANPWDGLTGILAGMDSRAQRFPSVSVNDPEYQAWLTETYPWPGDEIGRDGQGKLILRNPYNLPADEWQEKIRQGNAQGKTLRQAHMTGETKRSEGKRKGKGN